MAALTTAVAVAGVGLAGAGFFKSSSAAKKAARIQKQIAAQEMAIQEEQRKQMELDASRRTLEVFRNVQRTRAIAQANAVSQGAMFSSGLLGGYGQIQAEGNRQFLAIGQNLEIGRNIFARQKNISQLKMQLADASASMQVGQGLSSLGGALISNAGTLGNMFSGFGSANMYRGSQLPNSALVSGYGVY